MRLLRQHLSGPHYRSSDLRRRERPQSQPATSRRPKSGDTVGSMGSAVHGSWEGCSSSWASIGDVTGKLGTYTLLARLGDSFPLGEGDSCPELHRLELSGPAVSGRP